jgi:hypothetical protein
MTECDPLGLMILIINVISFHLGESKSNTMNERDSAKVWEDC